MIVVLLGPTGSGKSDLALALAEKLDAAIINGDAFQVYQELSIATNKPSQEVLGKIPHFLYDFVPLDSSYSVAEYQADARCVIDFLLNKKQNIIIEGGTGLYVKAALYDYNFVTDSPRDDSKYDGRSSEELHESLKKLDPDAAERIHPNNRQRIIRALQIAEISGETKSELEQKQEHKPIYPAIFIALDVDRAGLYERIDERVDEMFDRGLLQETLPLIEKYGRDASAFKAIGVKELFPYLDGEITLEEAKRQIKLNTRHYVKRQLTWLRHQFKLNWVKDLNNALDIIKA